MANARETNQDIPSPDAASIAAGLIVEGQHCDFKRGLDIEGRPARIKLVDDVGAFLNAGDGSGHIVLGVAERGGTFEAFHPISGNRDDIELKLMSIIQDGIDPKPLNVRIDFIDVGDGFLIDISIGGHRMQPYQNRMTGGFMLRTGAKNTPVPRETVRAMFVGADFMAADVMRLAEEEDRRTDARDMLKRDGATLHIGVLPRAHYSHDTPIFTRGFPAVRVVPSFYNDHGGTAMTPCDDGFEAIAATFDPNRANGRVFVSHTWFLYAQVVYPIAADAGGRVTVQEFGDRLKRYMTRLQAIFDEGHVEGPFAVTIAVRNLQRSADVKWLFEATDRVALPRPLFVERSDDAASLKAFHEMLLNASRYR